jgi:hypothetical protein
MNENYACMAMLSTSHGFYIPPGRSHIYMQKGGKSIEQLELIGNFVLKCLSYQLALVMIKIRIRRNNAKCKNKQST